MQQIDKRAAALAEIHMAWPKFTREQAMLYDRKLQDIPDVILYTAVDALAGESKYLPTIAEIRARAKSLYEQAAGIEKPDAGRGWGEVVKAIGHVGMNRFPKFDDPITSETVRRMGWKEICLAPVDSTSTLRAQFMRMYDMCAERTKESRRNDALLSGGDVKNLIKSIGCNLKMLT